MMGDEYGTPVLVPCPNCGSEDTRSSFDEGSVVCNDCGTPFRLRRGKKARVKSIKPIDIDPEIW